MPKLYRLKFVSTVREIYVYTVCQENRYFVKNMFLLKNPQFLPNHYETLSKWGPNEYFILTKFRNDWIKIVDFLIKAYFWQSIDSPDTQCNFYFFLLQPSYKNVYIKWSLEIIRCYSKKRTVTQKYAFIKKSTIFTQSLRNLVKIRQRWINEKFWSSEQGTK